MSIEKAFIGSLKKIKKTVVISPVFYPNKFGLKGERTPVGNIIVHNSFSYIKTYPSSGWIYDTVICLKKTPAKQIIFIGTGGAINKKYKIGDIVIARNKHRLLRANALAMTLSAPHVIARGQSLRSNLINIPTASVLSLDSILSETKENLNKFIKQNYDVVDLEASSFYKACKIINKIGVALILIQDKPLSKPFYKSLSSKDKERLKIGTERLIDICRILSENL